MFGKKKKKHSVLGAFFPTPNSLIPYSRFFQWSWHVNNQKAVCFMSWLLRHYKYTTDEGGRVLVLVTVTLIEITMYNFIVWILHILQWIPKHLLD